MIVELIYTSAPDTLDGPGYGVVAKTEGLPGRLEKFLRQLNRYDFDLSSGNASDHAGPVVFSHATSTDDSTAWHVLSRIGFGGSDYTQRAVFLAHHVAITADELRGARPADLLRSPSLFLSRWDRSPGLLPRRSIPAPARVDRGQEVWGAIAGHPDWARAWVDRWGQQSGRPCFLITPPGADVLGLFAGSSSLLGPDEVDGVDFITHMDNDRAGVRFDWIGLTAGGHLARSMAGRFPDRTLDLSRPLVGLPPAPLAPRRPAAIVAPLPRSIERPKAPVPTVATSHSLEEYWVEEPKAPVARRPTDPRLSPSMTAPPPPPPEMIPGGWNRPLTISGGIVLMAALCGSAWWVGRNGRVEPKPTEVAIVANSPTDPDAPRPPAERPDRAPGVQPRPSTGAVVSPVDPRPSEPSVPKIVATRNDSKPSAMVRPTGRWPLQSLKKEGDSTRIVDLDGVNFSQLQLLSAKGSALKAGKTEEKDGDLWVEIQLKNSSGSDEKIGLRLRRPTPLDPPRIEVVEALQGPSIRPKNSAIVEAQLLTSSADALLDELLLSVLRVKSATISGVEIGQTVDVSFAPTLPEIPLGVRWDCSDELKAGATGFFMAAHNATHRGQNPLKADFRIDQVSLSVLPANSGGWPVTSPKEADDGKKPAEWSPGNALTAEFEVVRRDDSQNDRWPITLTVETNFDRQGASSNQPAIKANIVRKATLDEPKKEGDAVTAVIPSKEQNRDKSPPPGSNRGKSNNKSPAETTAKPVPPADLKEVADSDLLLQILLRYGRARGSIIIPVTTGSGQPDGPDERIEILRFDAAPPASHQEPPGVGATHGP